MISVSVINYILFWTFKFSISTRAEIFNTPYRGITNTTHKKNDSEPTPPFLLGWSTAVTHTMYIALALR